MNAIKLGLKNIDTINIQNYKFFHLLYRELLSNENFFKYAQSNIELFNKLFGKPLRRIHKEYNIYVWAVEYNNCKGIIYSGKGYGTSISIIQDEYATEENVKNFYLEYVRLIELNS